MYVMGKVIKAADLKLIIDLIAPKDSSYEIFDPYLRISDFDTLPNGLVDSKNKVLVNLGREIIQYKLNKLDEFDVLIDFGETKSLHSYSEEVHFITNRNGDIRWLFKTSNFKHVLSTYSSNNFRSQLLSLFVKIISFLGLARIISSGSFRIKSSVELGFHRYMSSFDEGVVFLGTPGYYRKITAGIISNGRVDHFVKVPVSLQSERNLCNEHSTLKSLEHMNFDRVVIPNFDMRRDGTIFQSNNRHFFSQTNKLNENIQGALQEIASKTIKKSILWNSPLISATQSNLDLLKGKLTGENLEFYRLVEDLFTNLNKSQEIDTSLSHGDFTPWNVKVQDRKVYIFDWEFGRFQMPILYDTFHFLIQSQIYTKNKISSRINNLLNEVSETKLFQDLGNTIDLKLYLRLYVMHQISHILACIYFDGKVSSGLEKQLRNLFCMGSELLKEEGLRSYRIQFLKALQFYLSKSEGYSMMKLEHLSLTTLPESSDLDILVSRKFQNEIIDFIKSFKWRLELKVVSKSFMKTVRIKFYDGSVLYIDLINHFKRKSFFFLDCCEILNKSYRNASGLLVPEPELDFEYAFLFYNINHSDVPLKYFEFFSKGGKLEQRILNYIVTKYLINALDYKDLFNLDQEGRRWLIMIARHRVVSSPILWLKGFAFYVLDSIRSLMNDRGFVITFSGVDGIGKSTIIELFSNEIRAIHRKEVVLLRHRPRILPILSAVRKGGVKKAEEWASNEKPRQGNPSIGISSTLRFAYYYADYIFGQVFVYFKYVLKGKIVLYDRYYFDFIVDSKRSNIKMPGSVSRNLYSLLIKPKMNFLLWANAEEIHRRKQEVEPQEIEKLNRGYKSLFKDLSEHSYFGKKYLIVRNDNIDNTLRTLLSECKEVA